MRVIRYWLPAGLLTIMLVVVFAGCDSSDPSDEDFAEVSGNYTFTTYAFDPTGPALPTFSMLDTLVADETDLRLFDGGDFVLTYRFEGGNTNVVFGTYGVSDEEVSFRVSNESSGRLASLLLPEEFSLLRTTDGDLETEFNITVDLGNFSSEFAGTQAEGVLQLRLEAG